MNNTMLARYFQMPWLLAVVLIGVISCGGSEKIPGYNSEGPQEQFRVIEVPDSATGSTQTSIEVEDSGERDEETEPSERSDASDAASMSGMGDAGSGELTAPIEVTTWNLRNFSEAGKWDERIDTIREVLSDLDSDVVFLQEILRGPAATANTTNAIDLVADELTQYTWVQGAWQNNDSSVGILYRTSRFKVIEVRELFPTNNYAFPRPPLYLDVRDRESNDARLGLITVHLKAYEDDGSDVDRRREACIILDAFLQAQPDRFFILGGDLNDSPRDPPGQNVFTNTFLGESFYAFPTLDLPEEAFTFAGVIDGIFTGLFLDHFVLTRELEEQFEAYEIEVLPISLETMQSWIPAHSDHLPVTIRLQ